MPKGYYISLRSHGLVFHLFYIGFLSDGGYFIKGLTSITDPYFVGKVEVPASVLQTFGTEIHAPVKSSWQTMNVPKLSHHIDGNAQVSGFGIRSGFYRLTGKPKGIHVRSIDLRRPSYDGGPIFAITAWGLEKFLQGRKKNLIIFEQKFMYEDKLSKKGGRLAYRFEGFYVPKIYERYIDVSNGLFMLPHPNYKKMPTLVVPTPKQLPGFLAISCTESRIVAEPMVDHGITIGGGFGMTRNNTAMEQILIINPAIRAFLDGAEILDFGGWDRFLSKLDSTATKIRNLFM